LIQKVWLVLEKRKKFHAYSGTNGSLFRLWLRLLHIMLDVILIVCLVVFFCSMTYLKWLRLLNMPLKESCVVFIIWEHIIVVFSFDALFGLTWCMLTLCLTLTSCLKPLCSFCFWLVITLYALVNNVLSLCMIMPIIALLVSRSHSFAILHLYWEGILLVHPTPKKLKFSNVSTIYTY
jgi:hypothetical protein